MALPRGKLLQFINWRIEVVIDDRRSLVGKFMAFDKHMNLVMGECEEFRRTNKKGLKMVQEEKRALGFILLRGKTVVSITPRQPPPPKPREAQKTGGPGQAKVAGRGAPIAPVGLAGIPRVPGAGMGQMAPAMMMGRGGMVAGAPVPYPMGGRGMPMPPMMGGRGMPMMPGRGMPMPMMGRGRGMMRGMPPPRGR
eukprot:118447_1